MTSKSNQHYLNSSEFMQIISNITKNSEMYIEFSSRIELYFKS